MPEHEIAKHTKAIYKTWNSPHLRWKDKLIEVLIEIVIIVFAITLSLFFERMRERQHNREIEKEFLLGLKLDLINDIKQEAGDSLSYSGILPAWNYMRKAGAEKHELPKDTLDLYLPTLINTTGFIPNNSRFEALKSSGELGVIEKEALQNKILDLYQNKIRALIAATDYFSTMKQNQLLPFLTEKLIFQPNGKNNVNEVLQIPQMQNFMIFSGTCTQILLGYHQLMEQSRDIIRLIDYQYNL